MGLRARPYRQANCTLIARTGLCVTVDRTALLMLSGVTWGFSVERVTGIEPALSAWESDRSGSLSALTWEADAPPATVIDRVTPGLMAR
jgi:hypothetical protein